MSKTLPRSAKLRGHTYKVKHLVRMDACGMCEDDEDKRMIWIKLDQTPQDFLETIIHEGLHACYPDATEESVTESAEDLARLLWRYGYRRP